MKSKSRIRTHWKGKMETLGSNNREGQPSAPMWDYNLNRHNKNGEAAQGAEAGGRNRKKGKLA